MIPCPSCRALNDPAAQCCYRCGTPFEEEAEAGSLPKERAQEGEEGQGPSDVDGGNGKGVWLIFLGVTSLVGAGIDELQLLANGDGIWNSYRRGPSFYWIDAAHARAQIIGLVVFGLIFLGAGFLWRSLFSRRRSGS